MLAYFALNTWTFKLFDTVPYVLLESAVPGCGKSTVIRLLDAVSCRSRKASSLSEAVMFRLIDAEAPTLLIDEAETVDGRSDRAEALRAVAHEGLWPLLFFSLRNRNLRRKYPIFAGGYGGFWRPAYPRR